jgi:hypothetical protein
VPKFDASSIGGELEYDFSKWGGSKGVIPEPPRFAVSRMLKRVDELFVELGLRKAGDSEVKTPDDVIETMEKVNEEEVFEKMQDGLLEILAEVCGGSPSREDLEKLPYRPFQGFFGYLMGELTNPEASKPDTSNSRRLRSA